MQKLRWGILSTAKIAREKVIPALQASSNSTVVAIAGRNRERTTAVAGSLGILTAYDSYDALLKDDAIDAVYIPLPNHLHVSWAIKALEANKHVLCEKPIGLSSAEAKQLHLAALKKPQLKIMEAFMYRFHPQWQQAKKLVAEGAIGTLINIQSFFSYYNVDAGNIRNQKETGGGALMDIGCYCISLSRFIFNAEPSGVMAMVEFDPLLKTDRITSGILQFATGSSCFTCSTQAMPYQRVNIIGTAGRIEIEIPFNAPPMEPTRTWLHTKNGTEEIVVDAVDQYRLQATIFSQAVLDHTALPADLQDAVNNMLVIEAVFKSAAEKRFIAI